MELRHDSVHRFSDHVDHIHLKIKLTDTSIEVSGDARLGFFLSPSRSFLGTSEHVMTQDLGSVKHTIITLVAGILF